MIALVLSYFNIKIGPSILLSTPKSISKNQYIEIPKLLDLYDEGFSLQIFETYKSANLQFKIESDNPRGGRDTLLLSIITDIKYKLNNNIAKEILTQIKYEISEIKDIHKAFHSENDEIDENFILNIKQILTKHFELIQSTIQTLERAEIRYQALFKSARDAIFLIYKESSQIFDVNIEGIKLLEKKREQIVDQQFDDIFKFESKEANIFNQILDQCESNQTNLISTFLISHTGKKIGIEINTSTVQIGNELFIQCIVRDISKRLEIEEKLRKSEEKYRLIFENASDLIKVLNNKFQYEEINDEVHKRILGYSKEDLIFKSPIVHVHPEDRKRSSILLSRILRKGEGSFQARFKDKSGNIKWLEISAKHFIDSGGNKKYITIGRDITERKLAELKLIESEEKYRLITENASDLIAVIDQDLKHLFINEDRYKLKLGYTKEDLIGESALEIMHPDDIKTAINNRNKGLETGKAEGGLIRIKKKGGGWLWFETRSSIFSGVEGKRAIVISRDVTQQILDQKRF